MAPRAPVAKWRRIPLKQALSYQNDAIVHRFVDKYKISFEEAQEIFEETKKWVWLCAFSHSKEKAPRLVIDSSMFIIDEMWHNFVLFTKEYHQYCLENFGHFVHHAPATKADRDRQRVAAARNPELFKKKRLAHRRQMYGFVYDHLGAETLARWYSDYPAKYNPKRFEFEH